MSILQPKVIVPLALISGLTTSLSVYRYLRQETYDSPAAAVYQQVVVAAENISLGAALSLKNVRLVDWPKSQLPQGYFAEVSRVVGRVSRASLLSNEPIIEQRLAPEGSSGGLAGLIPAGKRALTVSVNAASGVSGFVLPKSRVDVIACIEPSNSKKESTSKTILQDVEVLAVDQKYQTENENPIPVQNVTLLVSPGDAEKLALASMQGRLLLALRNTIDDEPSKTTGAKFTDLVVNPEPIPMLRYQPLVRRPLPTDELQNKVLPEKRVIEIYRASIVSEVSFEASGVKTESAKKIALNKP